MVLMILKELAFSHSTKISLARVATGAPPKRMKKVEIAQDESRILDRMTVGLKVICDITRTRIHVDDIDMT